MATLRSKDNHSSISYDGVVYEFFKGVVEVPEEAVGIFMEAHGLELVPADEIELEETDEEKAKRLAEEEKAAKKAAKDAKKEEPTK